MWNWILENYQTVLLTATGVIAGASVLLGAVAKLTANKTDDKIAGWLRAAIGWLDWLALNVDLSKFKPAAPAPKAVAPAPPLGDQVMRTPRQLRQSRREEARRK